MIDLFEGKDMKKLIGKIILVLCLGLLVAAPTVAQSSDFWQGGKPPEKPKEKEKDPPKPDRGNPPRDDKDKKKKPDFWGQ